MKLRLVEDTDAVADVYLANLNAAFPGWGDAHMFDWCFRRTAGAPAADLFVMEEDGVAIAGSALTYRAVIRGGRSERFGCMTGSWTLPAARRRGIFGAMADASREQARRQGCSFIGGWGRASNGSYSTLAAMSARVIESAYLTAPDDGPRAVNPPCAKRGEVETAFASRALDPGTSRLDYDPASWRGQMIERPHTVEAWRLEPDLLALVERQQARDVLIDVSTSDPSHFVEAVHAAAAASRAQGKCLTTYSIDPETIEALECDGFGRAPGAYYMIPTDDQGAPRDESWWFANGDRM